MMISQELATGLWAGDDAVGVHDAVGELFPDLGDEQCAHAWGAIGWKKKHFMCSVIWELCSHS